MPHQRHLGEERDALAAKMKEAYEGGASVRELSETYEYSYGKMHRLLREAGVEFRGRGGNQRPRKKATRRLTNVQVLEYVDRLATTRRR